jgi:hypothetical protein
LYESYKEAMLGFTGVVASYSLFRPAFSTISSVLTIKATRRSVQCKAKYCQR